jgi:hypothetical protein
LVHDLEEVGTFVLMIVVLNELQEQGVAV